MIRVERNLNSQKITDAKEVLEYEKSKKSGTYNKEEVLEAMNIVRKTIDKIEKDIPKRFWPYPTYEDILFSV